MLARALPIARLVVAAGHEAIVVLPPWDSPQDSGATLTIDGVPVYHTPVPFRLPLLANPALAVLLSWRVARLQPDVVYAFKPKAFSAVVLLGALAARHLGLYRGRVVLDTDDWEGEGGWATREAGRFGWLGRLAIAVTERWCLRLADEVTVASRELTRRVASVRGRAGAYVPLAVAELPPDVPAESVARTRRELGIGAEPVVLAYTRFAEFEPRRLAEVFAAVAERIPTARFLVVGAGLDGEERDFAREAEAVGVASRVVAAGFAEREAIPRYLAAADVAVHLFDDTLMNRTKGQAKLIELLAAGVPVVVDGVGQAVEYVRSGETGVVVPAGDVLAMADAVCRLLGDVVSRSRIAARAREDVRRRWRWDCWSGAILTALGLERQRG